MLLARLPVSYRAWQCVEFFRHGAMDRPDYAYEVFCSHYQAAFGDCHKRDFVGLELGPGDSLFSALIGHSLGATRLYLVDVQPFADRSIASYRLMAAFLLERHGVIEDFAHCRNVDQILMACSAEYLTEGINSLRTIETGSVDFIWSHSVLQHIRKDSFLATMKELRRIQRPDGIGSHRIDLRDCLGGRLNNLRFAEHTWESAFWAQSGFYTNRIRYAEMLEIFQLAGFELADLEVRSWQKLPTPRHKMDPDFRKLPEKDLLISGFNVVLH